MADNTRTVTIKSITGQPWNKPGSEQLWYTIVVDEYPSEPIKFVRDKAKDAPEPVVGKSYKGNVYTGDKGMKFYAFGPDKRTDAPQGQQSTEQSDKPTPEYWDDRQAQIRAQWSLNAALQYVQWRDK